MASIDNRLSFQAYRTKTATRYPAEHYTEGASMLLPFTAGVIVGAPIGFIVCSLLTFNHFHDSDHRKLTEKNSDGAVSKLNGGSTSSN